MRELKYLFYALFWWSICIVVYSAISPPCECKMVVGGMETGFEYLKVNFMRNWGLMP